VDFSRSERSAIDHKFEVSFYEGTQGYRSSGCPSAVTRLRSILELGRRFVSDEPDYDGLAARLGTKRPSDLKMRNSTPDTAPEYDDDAIIKFLEDTWDARVRDGVRRMELFSR
jgi:hypothetical protein